MNEQTNQLIRDLAEKLWTTSEYLWQVLIRQAPIEAWTTLLSYGLPVLVLIVCLILLIRWIKEQEDRVEEWHVFYCCVLGAITIIAAILLLGQLPTIIAGLFNPEYWALKQILK